jgi:GTP-binding protein HflX
MIDTEEFMIPLDAKKALLLSDTEWGLDELEGLLKTMGGSAGEKMKLPDRRIVAGTYVGKGKLEEIGRVLDAKNLDLLLVDFDLSPSQLKNIEKALGTKLVLDRSGIILEIFSRHARSKEAKLQVELARMQYLMPRLTHLWSHFERQRGSGGAALKGKGMGEKQIEVDRRLVKDRINLLKRRLGEVEGARDLHRRHRNALLKVAIVGYTNAGKSTLLNALTHSDVLVEDALFATLDATVRLLNPKARPAILGIDTVGFIDRLPHGLVASFRSTLAEVLEADLLVHVLDASHPEVRRHFDVTMAVLAELGAADLPTLVVFNKMDLCKDTSLVKVMGASVVREINTEPPLYISARNPAQVEDLRARILKFFEKRMDVYEVVIPFEDGRTAAKIHEVGRVESTRPTDRGTFFRVRTMKEFAQQLNLEKYKL